MKIYKIDLEQRIFNLMLEIKHLVELDAMKFNGFSKSVCIEDFIDLMNTDFASIEEVKDEDS